MKNKKSFPVFLLLSILLLPGYGMLQGCGEDAPEHKVEYGEGEGLDVSSLTYGLYQILRSSDVPTEIGPKISTPYFDQKPRGLKVHGSPVLVLEFSSAEETDEFVKTISHDGKKVGDKAVTEKGTPHFFRKGKLVAVYFGDRQMTIQALELALGAQFAGGNSAGKDS